MKFPIHCLQKHQLVLVDLQCIQTGDFAPSAGGVVSVLEVFGGENQGGKEHASTTLHSPADGLTPSLVMGQIVTGHVRLNLNQIVQSHLQRAITGPRPAERLLDEGAKGQNTFAACS